MKMKFNSQICTTREQSERLLALGLKKETADMIHVDYGGRNYIIRPYDWLPTSKVDMEKYIPAWSLHRLMQIYTNGVISSRWNMAKFNWDDLIDCIEDSIVNGHFNKEYLV